MYSQRDEEKVILDLFEGRTGRLLDVGAYDGKTFSNTRALLERGWYGTLVEASPQSFVDLMKNTCDMDVDLVLANVVHVGGGKLSVFHNSPDAVSTIDENHFRKWDKVAGYVPITTASVSMLDLSVAFPEYYDFISLDVEGISLDILRNILQWLPLSRCLPEVICVEVDSSETLKVCEHMGYELVHRTDENIIVRRLV